MSVRTFEPSRQLTAKGGGIRPILQVNNLRKVYKRDDVADVALDGVSFSVEKGEYLAIVGTSGSGKSTLLHSIAGIELPDSGQVFLEGRNVFDLDEKELAVLRRRNIGIVYQFFNLLPLLRVEENILLPQFLDGRMPNKGKLDTLLGLIELDNKRKCFPKELSGGQQQLAAIARALINDPSVILADEPTGNLDSRMTQTIMDLFSAANRQHGQTLIVVTHDERIALQADRIITMKDGLIIDDERIR